MLAESDAYHTDVKRPRSIFSKLLLRSTLSFYPQLLLTAIFPSSWKALRGKYTRDEWIKSSLQVVRCLENVGIKLEIIGMTTFRKIDGPVVFISNHMSTLETFALPCIVQPEKPCTFVVKEELLHYPIFGLIMRSTNPIAVTRKYPKDDFITVVEEGVKKIQSGISVFIFPQTTRTAYFDPEEFNSLGIKLAVKAHVPVIPIALKTDAWGNGKRMKDFGKIDPTKTVHINFGEPIHIEGRGTEQHQIIIRFIQSQFKNWALQDENKR